MTKNSAHKKAARAYRAANPGTVLPEALRATRRASDGRAESPDTQGARGTGDHVWHFDNPKVAALVQALISAGPGALPAVGVSLPPTGEPVALHAVKPGDLVAAAGGAWGVLLGVDEGQMMVLTAAGAVCPLADFAGRMDGPGQGLFRLAD